MYFQNIYDKGPSYLIPVDGKITVRVKPTG